MLAAVILAHAAGATDGEAFSKLAKFLIFPLLAAAVLSKRGRRCCRRSETSSWQAGSPP